MSISPAAIAAAEASADAAREVSPEVAARVGVLLRSTVTTQAA